MTIFVAQRDIVTKIPSERLGYTHLLGYQYNLGAKWWHYLPSVRLNIKLHTDYLNGVNEKLK